MVHSIVLWDGGGIRETKEKKPKRLPKNKEMGLFSGVAQGKESGGLFLTLWQESGWPLFLGPNL